MNIAKSASDLHQEEPRWFAVMTKYKCEKHVASQLTNKGIAVYLPLITSVKKYVSGVKRRKLPLISTFVFVKIVKSEYVQVLESLYVRGFLKVGKRLISIPDKEIQVLRRVVGELEDVQVSNTPLGKGDKVEIIAGDLTGLQGTLVMADGKNRFVVELTSIGMQLSMSVDINKLRIIRRAAG